MVASGDWSNVVKRNDVFGGLVIIGLGLILLGMNLDLMPPWELGRLWPVVLVVLGAGKVLFPDRDSRLAGAPLLLVGGLFLAHNYDVLHIRQSWPLFIVSAGLGILAASCRSGRGETGKTS